ncbi:hypothetical protein LguiA_029276 [Lonicera macranthoides]
MEVPNYTIADFLRDTGPLQCREPRTTNGMWVFWSQEEEQGGGDLSPVTETLINNNWVNVQEYLKYLLCNVNADRNTLLIQFWAPTTTITSSTIGEGSVFKTSNQPFALYEIERGICEYRKHCTSLEFIVFRDEEKYGFDFGGKIRRVFRSKKADSFKNDRLLDFVPKKYGHTPRSLLLPLFKPFSRCCSGVLELVGSYESLLFPPEICNLAKVIFKEANFMNPPSLELQQSTEIEEINKALQGVCTTLQLPLAQIWVPCCTSTAMAYVDSPGERCHSPYLRCSSKFSSSLSQNGDAYIHYKQIEEFNLSCNSLRKGQSIVGKALLYHKPCFCRDVTQPPWAEYPNLCSSRMFKFTGCYAIWLHSTCTKNHDYVLEFYIPHCNTISGDPHTFLGLLLATVKKQLPGFEISSVGEESCVKVYEIFMDEVVGEIVIDSGSNILGLEENGIVVCHSDYTIVDFLKYMAPFNLSYMEPRTGNIKWVFWSQEGEGGGDLDPSIETLTNNNWENVQEYLKYILRNAKRVSWANVALIQFWAPTTTTSTIGGRCVLKTSNQPFGLYGLERGICEYRKHCTSLEFDEEDNKYEFGSVIWQVFRYKKAKYDRLGDFAHKCGIGTSYFLPLFKPSSWCCSGVLEISVTFQSSLFRFDLYKLAEDIFKEANFINPSSLKLQQSTEIEEINKALQGVCTTLQLPLAQIWVPCCTSTAMAYVDSPGERCHSPYLSCSGEFSSSICQNGRSVVGKALLYHKPCFCRDLSQLAMAVYPSSNTEESDTEESDTEEYVEELSELGGRCAIWLHSTCTNHDYVLEFCFSPWNTFCGVPQTGLELLLATVKKQLAGFKISSVGKESCVEVNEISVKNDGPDSVIIISHCFSVKLIPESFANEKETVQNEVVGETVIDNRSNILGLEEKGIVVCHSEKTAGEELFVATDDEISVSLPPMEEAVRKNELNVGIVKQTNAAVTSSERIFSRAEASGGEYRTSDITLSYEDLSKHFGKKLDDAAQILGGK